MTEMDSVAFVPAGMLRSKGCVEMDGGMGAAVIATTTRRLVSVKEPSNKSAMSTLDSIWTGSRVARLRVS